MNTNEIFPKGQKAGENFTGDTWVQMLTVDGQNFDAMSYNVTFAAGSRTYCTPWRSNPILPVRRRMLPGKRQSYAAFKSRRCG